MTGFSYIIAFIDESRIWGESTVVIEVLIRTYTFLNHEQVWFAFSKNNLKLHYA